MLDLSRIIAALQLAVLVMPPAEAPVSGWTAGDFPAESTRGVPLKKGERAPAYYPVEALRHREQGRTVASVRVGTGGRAVRCTISQSSGSASLDKETCRLAFQSVRWNPARDPAGNPIESDTTLPVTWQLPR